MVDTSCIILDPEAAHALQPAAVTRLAAQVSTVKSLISRGLADSRRVMKP